MIVFFLSWHGRTARAQFHFKPARLALPSPRTIRKKSPADQERQTD